MRYPSTAAICLPILLLATPSLAQSPDTNFYYKLSTQFRGTGMPMDVFNGGPSNNQARLDKDQNVTGQNWRFVPADRVMCCQPRMSWTSRRRPLCEHIERRPAAFQRVWSAA